MSKELLKEDILKILSAELKGGLKSSTHHHRPFLAD